MGEKSIKLIIFAAGAVFGSALTYKFVKDKYMQIAEEEIASMREYYNEKLDMLEYDDIEEEVTEAEAETVTENKPKPDLMEYASTIEAEGYDSSYKKEKPSKKEPTGDEPYVISPEEFGTIEEYDTITLMYYTDGYLADADDDDLIDNVEDKIGWDAIEHFGDYEDDSVHVRNDALQTDYEILRSMRTYAEIRQRFHTEE